MDKDPRLIEIEETAAQMEMERLWERVRGHSDGHSGEGHEGFSVTEDGAPSSEREQD